jgi:MFS superfamily sulfate permease-like transporter
LSIEAADALDPYKRITPTNQELKAQGVGNILSGLLGGLPLTSVVVRTSANVNAGAQTKLSAIIHGLLLLLCVAFLPAYLNYIPLSALAAVLIYTGFKLAKPALFKQMFQRSWDQFIPFIVTIGAIIFTDLLKGIIVGMLVGLYYVLRSNFKSNVYMVNVHHNYLVRLRKDVSYLNKPIVKKKLNTLPANAHVIIDVSHADFIDRDIIEVMNDFLVNAHVRNITVEVKRSPYKPIHQLIGAPPDNNSHH